MKKRITGKEMTTKDWAEWDKQPLPTGIWGWFETWSGVLLLIVLIAIILLTKW